MVPSLCASEDVHDVSEMIPLDFSFFIPLGSLSMFERQQRIPSDRLFMIT